MKRKYRKMKFPIKLATPLEKILKLTKLSPGRKLTKSKKVDELNQKEVNIEIEPDQKS